VILSGGLDVFPRLVAAASRQDAQHELVSCCIPEMDALLGGGMHRGTSNLLIGPAGSGKSTLALHYALAAANRGERALYFAFDESPATMETRAKGVGLGMSDAIKSGCLKLQQIDPAEMTPGEFIHRICREVENEHARVVVIDSLNGFMHAMPDERFLLTQLHELLTYLGQRGVLTIMVLAQHGLVGRMESSIDLTYLADTVILLRYFEATGKVKKAISVIKKRSGAHEDTIREYAILEGGAQVGPPLTDFQGVLSGMPVFAGRDEQILRGTDDQRPS
jgi:circadian clock protein KaiC